MSTGVATQAMQDTGYAARAARLQTIVEDPRTMDVLVQRLLDGETVKEIARAWDVPHGALSAWVLADKGRAEQYLAAQQVAAHTLVEETLELADDVKEEKEAIAKAKLQIDTRLRVAGFHAPGRYGAKAQERGPSVVVVVNRDAGEEPVTIESQATETTPTEETPHGDHSGSPADRTGE